MPRHRHKRAPIPPAAPTTVPVEATQVSLPESNGHVDERAVQTLLQEIPRDNPVPTGQPLPSPGIPDTWGMRPGAREITVSNLHTGPETTLEALRALCDTNQPAYVFQRYGRLTRITPDEHRLPAILDVNQGALKGILSRAAKWQVEVKLRNGEIATQSILPPGYVIEDIASHGDWPAGIPALKGISGIPILHKDGSLHAAPGYDEITGYWYEPSGPLVGTAWDIIKPITSAVRILDDWLSDFPFAGQAEKASALAFFLTLLARPVIEGNIPLGLVMATKSRTGKTLLVETILLAVLGVLPALSSAPQEEAEWRKLLASCALHGRQVIVLDNLNGLLDSAALASVLTTGMISDRLLKTNDVLDMRAGFVMVATGNQLQTTTELLARSYRCKLDAAMSRPQDRTGFHHPDILAYTRDLRHKILEAGYALLAGYLRAGRPKASGLPRKGGFEQWVDIVGGTLSFAGIPGFLDNEGELAAGSDESESEMEGFLTALLTTFQHKAFKVSQLLEEANKSNSPLSTTLPARLAEVLVMRPTFTSKAGLFLKKHKGVHYGRPDMWVESVEAKHSNTNSWCVLGDTAESVPPEESTPLTPEQDRIARNLIEEEAGNA